MIPLFLSIVLLLLSALAPPVFAQTTSSPILAIGDSITAGTAGPSYLCPLKNSLPNATFVGRQGPICGARHAGYGGYTTIAVYNNRNDWIPSVSGATVLIHLGTNDANSGFPVDVTISKLRQIIAEIKSHNPAKIILAQIIPTTYHNTDVGPLNAAIANLAQETQVVLVNAGNGFSLNLLLPDGIHPTAAGAAVMAQNFLSAISGLTSTTTPEPPILVDAGLPNQPGGIVDSKSLEDTKDSILNFFFGGGLKPKDLRIPTFSFNIFNGAVRYLMPKVIQDKTIPAENNLAITGKATLCVRNPATGELQQRPGTNLYRTQPIRELSDQISVSRELAPVFSNYSLTPNGEGLYDLRQRPLEIANAPACGEDITASAQESVSAPVDSNQEVSFAQIVVRIIRSFFGNQDTANVSATVYSRQVVPHQEDSYCLIRGCTNETVKLSYLKKEEANNVQKAGGITQAFAPKVLDFSEGQMHGEQPSTFSLIGTIKTRIFGSKAIENSTKNLRCSLLPQALQQKEGLNCTTKQSTNQTVACTASCQTANDACDQFKGQYTESNKGVGPINCGYTTSGLPGSTAVQNALVAAGKYFGVPPKLLAAVLIIENGDVDERGILSYSDATAQQAITEGGFDQYSCTPNQCGATGPMQLSTKGCNVETSCPVAKDNWKQWCQFRHAANELRGKNTYLPNPANIQDAFAVAAKKMSGYLNNAACPTNLAPLDYYKVGHTYYGNCLDARYSRFLPNRPGLSAFLQTRATEIIQARHDLYDWLKQTGLTPNRQPSGDKSLPTYCDFLWWYSTTH